jgi:hypothetical protein
VDSAVLVVVLEDAPPPAAAGSSSSSSSGSSLPCTITVLARPVQLPAPDAPVEVLVAGRPRRWAHAKHCQWVLDRRQLEALKGPTTAEVVLAGGRGELLEGLASNVFVVATAEAGGEGAGAGGSAPGAQPQGAGCEGAGAGGSAQGAGCDEAGDSGRAQGAAPGAGHDSSKQGAPEPLRGVVLLTNSPGDAALAGITQRRVVEAAAAVGLAVELRAPRMAERGRWLEAFTTNWWVGGGLEGGGQGEGNEGAGVVERTGGGRDGGRVHPTRCALHAVVCTHM